MAPTEPRPPQGDGDKSCSTNGNHSSASPSSTPPPANWVGNNMAQALRDLARGEQTAAALEANLTNLESKLDELLASFGTLSEEAGTDETAALDAKRRSQDGDKKGEGREKRNGETS